mmetsp:Transcript_14350/g.22319  ORF Transcript_14350/g.22319 Transcript_14350/m.22319 type:complete len:132 (-) Transcript_14350:220-615(-)
MSTTYQPPDMKHNSDPMDDPRNSRVENNWVRLIILITTLFAVVCLCMRTYYKVKWTNNYFQNDSETHIYFQYNEAIIGKKRDDVFDDRSFLNPSFFLELAVLLICPLPYYDRYIPMLCKQDNEVVYLLSEF